MIDKKKELELLEEKYKEIKKNLIQKLNLLYQV